MPKVEFLFDKERDLWNIWDTCNHGTGWGYDFTKKINPKILKLCKNKKLSQVKKEIEECRKELYDSDSIPKAMASFNKEWAKINNRYFVKLEEVMKKPICCELFKGYLTTVGRCPYDFNKNHPSFFVKFSNKVSSALKTAAHEIMHIQFHNTYWDRVIKKLGKEKTEDLKEALTVLLNLEFNDLGIAKDEGYPDHEKLREFISEQWKKEKDFDVLIEKCIKWFNK